MYAGGAIATARSDFELVGCLFIGNRAIESMGGAVYNYGYGLPVIVDCTFEDNSADQGGAVYIDESCDPNVIGCTFLANEATNNGRGGALFFDDESRGTLLNNRLMGNTAGHGGAICVRGFPTVVNCVFSGNSSARGAPISLETGTFVDVINSTFSANVATDEGGALYGLVGTIQLSNCVLWNDSPHEIYMPSGLVQVHYSNVQGADETNGGNIDADPRFQDPLGADGVAGTIDDNLCLSLGSPCIDAGNEAALPAFATTDLDGLERVVGGQVNMGAYEFHGPFNCYVDATTGDDASSGWGPREAFATVQRGIEAAQQGYTVVVMPGVYSE